MRRNSDVGERDSTRRRGRSESKRSNKNLFQTGVDRLVGRCDEKDYEVTIVFQYAKNVNYDQETSTPVAPPRRRRSRSQSLCSDNYPEAPTPPPRSRSCSRKTIKAPNLVKASEARSETSVRKEARGPEEVTQPLQYLHEVRSGDKPPLPTKYFSNICKTLI